MPMKVTTLCDSSQEDHDNFFRLTGSRSRSVALDAITSERALSPDNARVSREWFTSGAKTNEGCGRGEWINHIRTPFSLEEYPSIKTEVAAVNMTRPVSEAAPELPPLLTCKSEIDMEDGQTTNCHRNSDPFRHRLDMDVRQSCKVEELHGHDISVGCTPHNYVASHLVTERDNKLTETRRKHSRDSQLATDSLFDGGPLRRRRSFSSAHDKIRQPLQHAPVRRCRSVDCLWSVWARKSDVCDQWTLRAQELDGRMVPGDVRRRSRSPDAELTDRGSSTREMPKLKRESELWLQSADQSDVIWERGAQSATADNGGDQGSQYYPLNYAMPQQVVGQELTTWSGDIEDGGYHGEHCVVCGEVANGNFFGAVVCLPCKSFFIRCTKDGEPCILQQCHGQCDIKKQLRNRCQYCRYKQCLAVGMSRREKPESIQPQDGQELCRVCGDLANGIHFGVYTCEGCKKFFRRGLKEHTSYVCKDEKSCRLNPRNRNNCRFCRYQKCLSMGMSREAIKMGRPRKLCPSRPMDHMMPSTNQINGVFPSYNSNYIRSHDQLPVTDHQNFTPRGHCDPMTNNRSDNLWMPRDLKRSDTYINRSIRSNRPYLPVSSPPVPHPQSHTDYLHVPMSRLGELNDLDHRASNQRSAMLNQVHQSRGVLHNSVTETSLPHQRLTSTPHPPSHPPNAPHNSLPPHNRGADPSVLHERPQPQHQLSFEAQLRCGHSTSSSLTDINGADRVAFKHSTNHHRDYRPQPRFEIPQPHSQVSQPRFGSDVKNSQCPRMPKLVQVSQDIITHKTLGQGLTPRGGNCDVWNTNKPLSSVSYHPMPPSSGRANHGLMRSHQPPMESMDPQYQRDSDGFFLYEPSVLDLRVGSKPKYKEMQASDASDYIVNEILKGTSGYLSYNSLKRPQATTSGDMLQEIYPRKLTKLDHESRISDVDSKEPLCNKIRHHSSHQPGSGQDGAYRSGQCDELVIKSEVTFNHSHPHARTSSHDVVSLPQSFTAHNNTDLSQNNLSALSSGQSHHTKGPTTHTNQQGAPNCCVYPLTTCKPCDGMYITNKTVMSCVQQPYTSSPASVKSNQVQTTVGLSTLETGLHAPENRLSQFTNGLAKSLIPVVPPFTKPPMDETTKPLMDGTTKPPMDGTTKPPMDGTTKPPMDETGINHPNTKNAQTSSSSIVSQSDPPEHVTSSDRFDPYTNEQTLVYINEMFLVVDTLTDTSLSASQNFLKGKSTSELDAIDNMFTNIYGYSPLKVNHFWRSLFSYMPRGTTERWQGALTSRQGDWLKVITNNYASHVTTCDEELNPPAVDTNKFELWPGRGEDLDHWKHFQERVARQTFAEAQFVLKLPDIEEIHPKDRLKLGNNTRLFGNTILMASKEWFDPVRKKFKFFWNWKLPQDHPLGPFRNRIIKTGSRIFNLHMDKTEVALLSALNIMSPENATFQNLPRIWDYTHTLMKILGHYLSTINVDPDDRIPELLSVMPKVRHMSMWYSNLIRNMRADPTSMDKTLQDLTKTAGKLVSTSDCKGSSTELRDLQVL